MEVELGLAPLSDMLLPPLDEELDLDLLGGDFLSLLQGGEGVCAGLGDLEGPQHLPNNPLYSLHAPPPCHQATAVVPCASPTPSVDTAPASPQPCEAAPPAGLLPVAQQQVLPSGPLNACRNSALRLVTTQAPLLHGSVSNNSMFGCPQLSVQQRSSKGPYCSGDRPSCSQDYDEDDSEDSEDTDQGLANPCGGATAGAGVGSKHNKRKAPEVDWKSIEDPAERRRQRRLAKNRVTAARSRERKKLQWADMEAKIQAIETENSQLRSVLEQFARENSLLKEQLMQLTRPGGAKRMNLSLGKGSTTTEPAALVLIATLLVLCCFLPADKAMMLGSALPLLVLSQLQQLMQQGVDGSELFEALLRLVACIQRLVAMSSLGFRRYVHCLLFKRHHFCGCKAMQDIGDASMLFAAQSLALCKYESVDELMLDPKVVDVAPCSGMVPLAPLHHVPAPVPQDSYGSSNGFFGAAFADVVIKAEVVF